MDTRNARLVLSNVVVVFEALKFGPALSELARRLLPGHPSPLITEIPDQLLAVAYPERQIQCQFANRRLDVRDTRGVEPGAEPFSETAVRAIEAAAAAGASGIVAYGYNYELLLSLREGDPGTFLQTRFFTNPQKLGDAFGGKVGAVGISASVELDGCQANFDIGPQPEMPGYLKAHVNYHCQDRRPPQDGQLLAEEMRQKYEDFKAALERL